MILKDNADGMHPVYTGDYLRKIRVARFGDPEDELMEVGTMPLKASTTRFTRATKLKDDLEELAAWAAEDDADKRFSNALARDNNKMIEEDEIKAAVDPKHHKGFIDELQWLDVMSRIPRYRNNPEAFKGAVELQIRKYLDRNGRKDNELQELLKGLWYYKYLCAYLKNGCNAIAGDDVDRILAK